MARNTDSTARMRLYCPELVRGINVIQGGEAHHALHVMRLGRGQNVELFDGRGQSAAGLVQRCRRDALEVFVEQEPLSSPAPRPEVHLGFAVAKGKRLDWLLEKACELGAASMTPVRFQRSVAGGVGAGGSKRRRWEATCISAAKQCGADHLSRIGQEADLETFLASARGAKLLGQAGAPRISDVLDLSAQSICLLVGPEGGLTGQERDRAVESGFAPVAVGGHTLRIETAGVALLAGVRSLFPGF